MYIYTDKKLGKGSFNHLYEGNDRDRQYSFKASLIVPDFTFLYNFCARQFMQFPFFFGLFFISILSTVPIALSPILSWGCH